MKKLAALLLFLMPSLAISSGIYNPGSGGSAVSGGASSLQVTQSGVEITSPTASINFRSGDFKVRSIGTTSYVLLDPGATNYIQNTLTPTAATQKFSVATGTFTTKAVTPNITFSATSNLLTHQDGTQLLSTPDTNSMYFGYNTNLINTGGVFNFAAGPTCMPYPGSGNFNSCIGPFGMSANVITTAENNNAMGYAACGALRAGFYNSCMGGSSGNALRDGNYNSYNGAYSGFSNVDNNGNTASGFESSRYLNGGDYITSMGYQAGNGTATVNANVTGSGNSYLGMQTGQDVPSATAISNSFAIGRGALFHASREGQLGGRLGSGFETLVRMASGTVETSFFQVAGKNVCLADGTNCPAAAASEFKVSLSTGTFGFIGISTQTNLTATGSANLNVNAVNVGPISLSTGVVGVLPVANGGHSEFLVSLSTGVIGAFNATASSASATGSAGLFSQYGLISSTMQLTAMDVSPTSATVSGSAGLTVTNLSASLPVKTTSGKTLTAEAIDLSGSEVNGTLAAGRMPALLGDTTNSAGNLTTVLNTTVANNHNFTGQLILGGNGNKVQISSNTILVGATFYQNGSVAMDGPVVMGAIGTSVTISSNAVMPGATFYQNGQVVMGNPGNSVTISSNTILVGATFYQNGVVTMPGPVTLGAVPGNSVTISSNAVLPGCTFYQNGVIKTNLSASLPVITDSQGALTATAVNLSGAQATGTMAAARMPALTGDITTSAGAVATTLNSPIANTHTFSGATTFSSAGAAVIVSAGQLRLFSRTNVQIGAITPAAVGEMVFCSDCTALQICVSSGTAVGAFASPVAKTTACK